jgi:FAD/FMN-containing dehydrogenase
MVWSALKPERFPDAIVHVESEADVREAIHFARRHDLKVAIRGGGHNWHNAALRQGGVLLDLSGLKELRVDAEQGKAIVQPGVRGSALMASLAPHGLSFPITRCPEVPLSGFLLNGGIGFNQRVWGPACANIEALDIVNARGELIRADKDRNADLFWAARGAGPGFFGVVTRFHLKVHSLPRAMLRSELFYPVEEMEKVAAWFSQLAPRTAALVELSCSLTSRGAGIIATAFADTPSDARKALQALEAEPTGLKARSKSLYEECSVKAVFGTASDGSRGGPRFLGDNVWSNASAPELLSRVRDAILSTPSGGSHIGFHWLPQGYDGPPKPDMAFSMCASTYVGVYSGWNDAAQDVANRAWVRTTIASLEPLKVGHYVGEADLTRAPDRAKQCFSPAAWARLIRLKRKHDPDDVFFSYLQET